MERGGFSEEDVIAHLQDKISSSSIKIQQRERERRQHIITLANRIIEQYNERYVKSINVA